MPQVLCDGLKCDKLTCRYSQNDATHQPSGSNFSSHQLTEVREIQNYTPRKEFKANKRKNRKSYCVSYFSSASINRRDMKKMLDCVTIDLSGNKITEIAANLFETHEQLESLILDNNQLKFLPENIFDSLVNLKTLSIKNNLLQALNPDVFKHNTKLELIDLSHNKLFKVSPTIFDNLPDLKFVSFHGNICVDSVFPKTTLDEMKLELKARCGERNLVTFVVYLMKISSQLRNSSLNFNATASITAPPALSNDSDGVNRNATNIDSNIDTLLTSLFWLIIPVIFILLAILAIITYAIYNKYFTYSLNYPRDS